MTKKFKTAKLQNDSIGGAGEVDKVLLKFLLELKEIVLFIIAPGTVWWPNRDRWDSHENPDAIIATGHCLSVTGAFTRHFWAWPSSSLSAPWRPVMPVNGFLTSEVKLWKSNEHLFWFEHLNWSHTFLRAINFVTMNPSTDGLSSSTSVCCTVLDVKPTLEGS